MVDARLNSGTVVRDLQPLNIFLINVTAAVLNGGTVVRDLQSLNMYPILVVTD